MALIRIVDQTESIYSQNITLEVDVLHADDPTKDERHFIICTADTLSDPKLLVEYIESSIRATRRRVTDVVGTEWKSDKL